MRNLLTTALASFALATLIAGSAAAADSWTTDRNARQASGNIAEQDVLERDAAQSWLRRGGEGVIISRGDNSPSTSRLDQSAAADQSNPWLRRSPAGEVVGGSGNPGNPQPLGQSAKGG